MSRIFTPLFLLLSVISFAAAPTVSSSNISFNAIDGAYFNIAWSKGNGTNRIIVAKVGTDPTFVPQNGVGYTANTIFGLGQQVAPDEFIIYNSFSSSFFLTGLTPATQYFFRIYDYNGTGSSAEYLTSSFASGNGFTSASPSIQTSNAVFSSVTTNSAVVSWTNGNGGRRLVVVREGSAVTADPVNSQPYNVSSSFGNGATIGTGNYTVYNGSSTSTSVTNLKPGNEYFFSFYEFNGTQQPQYLTPAYTTNIVTRSVPTVASSALIISKTDGQELHLSWTSGNGQRRIIIAKQGSNVLSVPANGTDYDAGIFGLGQQIGAGEYVVYDGNFNSTIISGLNAATTYYFKVFEYDGTGSSTSYLTSSYASVNGSTAVTPSAQAQLLASTNVTSNSVQLNFTPGDGRARLIIGRKNFAVNFSPVNFTSYVANSDFGSGEDLGSGNFVLFAGTESAIIIHDLQASSTYHFAVYEFNGYNQPLYLSPAAVGSITTSGTLPVKLISWEALSQNGKVKLQWKTANEINSSHFIIERSADGTNFYSVGTVNANGNSQVELSYSKDDVSPLYGKSYYRLKIVDLDGTFDYSPVRTVSITPEQAIKIVSNPVRNNLRVLVADVGDSRNGWQIVNSIGQIIKRGVLMHETTDIDVSSLSAGNYWLKVGENYHNGRSLLFIKE